MKYVFLTVLVILTVLVFYPPLHYGYLYPTAGDDSASHILYFMNINTPDGFPDAPPHNYPLYYGQYIVARLLNVLPFNVVSSFLWFNYIMLAFALWAVGLTVGLATNWLAGLLASVLVFGRSYLLVQFSWGVIFDIIGIAVLLPILLLCLHKFDKGIGWKIGMIISLPLFAVFHVNGQYLFALVPIYIVYEVVSYLFVRKDYKFGKIMRQYRILGYCMLLTVALVMAYFIRLSIDPTRILLDASILFMMCVGIVISLLVGSNTKAIIGVGLVAVIVIIPQFQYWIQDNSAIKEADKQAIAYVNSLSGKTCEASLEVTENIYRLYVNKQWIHLNADYIIVRSSAMTETSAIAVKHGKVAWTLDGYKLLDTFDDGEIEQYTGEPIRVLVYGRES